MNPGKSYSIPLWLFFIHPLSALLISLRRFKALNAPNIIWLFVIFYGFTFVISDQSIDASRYATYLREAHVKPVGSFAEFVGYLYSQETNYVDVVQPLLTFLVSRLTDNPQVLFAVFGVFFGYFYSRNIWFLLSQVRSKLKPEAMLFLTMAAFAVSIWQMNGFRFWTAAHVFAFGVFYWAADKRVKGMLFCFLSVFVHFSFVFPLVVFVLYVFAGNWLLPYFMVFTASIFVSLITPATFSEYTRYLPAVFQQRTETYTSKEYLRRLGKESRVQVNWYVRARQTGIQLAIPLMFLVLVLRYRKYIEARQLELRILCFSLVMGSVVNLLSAGPSVGRFYHLYYILSFGAIFLICQGMQWKTFPLVVRIPVFAAVVLFVVVEIRIGFDTMGLMTVLGNPIASLFVTRDIPLINFIK